jgi:mono/diheme cytochrome c family protein
MQNSSSWKRKLSRIGIAVGTLVAAGSVATYLRATRQVQAPYPDIRASTEPAVIERGRYLVEGAAHCGECHGVVEPKGASRMGRPLVGGLEFELPVGTFRVPNITPDPETGIGKIEDKAIARLLRYGVKPNGEMALPFMPYADLSDEDITAIISYLRTQKPIKHEVAPHDVNPLGRVVQAFVLQPKGPSEPPRRRVPPAATPAYGKYLTHSVGNCVMCHTQVDRRTGAFAGPLFGGGAVHDGGTNPDQKFVSPNLTPDPRWGWLRGWDEDAFVARFRAGRVHANSPMPWESVQNMTETDLRAIYRYLQTLTPAQTGPDPKKRDVLLATARH